MSRTKRPRPSRLGPWVLCLAGLCACRSGPPLFEESAQPGGLEFTSYAGDHLWYLLDVMGSGLAAGDYDGDGNIDLYFCSGSAILDSYQEEASHHGDALWRNGGQAQFTDVTRAAGLGVHGWSNGAVFADLDGDGDLDLFVARLGRSLLYRNEGDSTFREVGKAAGIDHIGFGSGAAIADLDGDGDLDIYLTEYARYDPRAEKGKVSGFSSGVMQFPQFFEPEGNVLYRNNGDGTFTDITREANAAADGRSLGVVATDYDDDGDLDLFVANDVGPNNLLQNDGGKFTEVGLLAGVAYNGDGQFEASMGAAAGDIDNDGRIDLIVTNYGGEKNTLYRNEGGGAFSDFTKEAGLINQRVLDSVGWGVGFYDFDLDGNLDLLVVNGHVVPGYVGWYMRNIHDSSSDIPQMRSEAYRGGARQSKILFLGRGGGKFQDATDEAGDAITDPRRSRGAAFADFDGDGLIDVAVSNRAEPAQVILNRMPRRGNWVILELRAPSPNVFAVGARVQVFAGGRTFTREVYAGSSYLSGDDLACHFGLGPAAGVDKVEVRWPDKTRERFEGLPVNRRVRVVKGTGTAIAGP